MSWTKRQFVEEAFAEIGLAVYTFDLDPEQLQTALTRLDSMVATWNGKGIRLGYPIPSSPELSDLDEETNVPDSANEGIYANLAIRIAPLFGKVVSKETRDTAKGAYNLLLQKAAFPQEQQMPHNVPAGAGNKRWGTRRPFLDGPEDKLSVGPDDILELE